MSLSRIESGGNQVKDSMTQLAETIQKSQNQFETAFNNSFKDTERQDKKVEDSKEKTGDIQNTGAADKKADTSKADNTAPASHTEREHDQKDSKDSSSSNDTPTKTSSEEEDASQDSPSHPEIIEQTLNQSDLLLLSLLITPRAFVPIEPQNTEASSDLYSFTETEKDSSSSDKLSQPSSFSPDLLPEISLQEPQAQQPQEDTSLLLKATDSSSEPYKKAEIHLKNQEIVAPLENQTSHGQNHSENSETPAEIASTQAPLLQASTTEQNIKNTDRNISKNLKNTPTSEISMPESTSETVAKKRPLKIDDLIFELRHPEIVLKRSQDHEINIKNDRGLNQDMEKIQSIQNQFLSAMKTIIDRHEEKMVIHLDPPEWGKIDVQLKLQNKELNVQIRTEQAFVKESLEKGVPELRQAFSGQGLQLGHLNIGLGQQATRDQNQEDAEPASPTIIKKQNTNKPRWRDPRSIVDRVV